MTVLPGNNSLLAAIITVIAMVALDANVTKSATVNRNFSPGQMWSIRSSSPTPMKVIIGRIEVHGEITTAHVSLIDVPIPEGLPGAGGSMIVDHAPFELSALASSVDKLIATGVQPALGFQSGYDQWKSARGGVYTITVSRAVALMFEAVMRRE